MLATNFPDAKFYVSLPVNLTNHYVYGRLNVPQFIHSLIKKIQSMLHSAKSYIYPNIVYSV